MKATKLLTLTSSLLLFAGTAKAQYFHKDVGTPAPAGSVVTNADNSLAITAGGNDIWGTSDNFHYYYTWASGQQWSAVVKVTDLQGPDNWTKAELMVRWSDVAAGPQGPDPFIAAMTTRTDSGAANRVSDQFRPVRGGNANAVELSPQWYPQYPNQWMRLTRTNSIFTMDFGTDGVNWTNYFTVDTSKTANGFGTPWPDVVAVGLAVTAHNTDNATSGTGTFSGLQVSFPTTIKPPTVIGATTQVKNATNYNGCEVSFSFATTNNAVPDVVQGAPGLTYQWYKNGAAVPGATTTRYTTLAWDVDNDAQVYCQATLNPPYNTTVSGLKSDVATIRVQPGALTYTNGLKVERFYGASRLDVERGNVGATTPSMISGFDISGGFGDNYAQRVSGWFIPPATGNYSFNVASDDDCDLFLSTDNNPANKRIIAQEMGWSGYRTYETAGSGATDFPQKCSDTWQADINNPAYPAPFASGIPLNAGQLYYLEAVMHQGGGGDNLSVTYRLTSEAAITNGTPSRLNGTNNNIVLITSPTTNLVWAMQPTNSTVYDGFNAVFTAQGSSATELALKYQWYKNGSPVAGATSTVYRFSPAIYADNNTQLYVVANTSEGGLSITSSVVTLTVLQSVVEKGWAKVEYWDGSSRQNVENGTAGDPTITYAVPAFEASVNNEDGNLYGRKVSAFFIPPQSDVYDFFVCSDDASDVYLSTDSTPGNKRIIAQETGWSQPWKWVTTGDGTGAANPQKRSDQFQVDTANPTTPSPFANGIALTAGQMYYLEVVQGETGGGDNVEVTYKLHNTGLDPVDGNDTMLKGNVLGLKMNRANYVAFTQHPSNTTATVNGKAVLTAVGITDSTMPIGSTGTHPTPPYTYVFYQWYKNGVAIPGATTAALTLYPVQPSDNGAQFMCKMRALGYVDNAQNPIWSNSQPATLTVAGQSVFEVGFLQNELWYGKVRSDIEGGTLGAPDELAAASSLALSGSIADNYARRLVGYFIAPATDNYVFFVNADDDADLFVSTDDSPITKRLVAQQSGWGSASLKWLSNPAAYPVAQKRSDQFTDPATGTQPYTAGIRLTAGQRYYMEAVHHEGTGGDYLEATFTNVANAWWIQDGTPSIMLGNAVGFYAPRCTYVAFAQQPQSLSVPDLSTVTLTAAGISDSTISIGDVNGRPTKDFVMYQWYKNGAAIPGATRGSLTLNEAPLGDNGAQFVCAIRALGFANNTLQPIWSNSQPATLSVVATPPQFVTSALYTDYNITNLGGGALPTLCVDLAFSKRMDATILSNAVYSLTGGLTVTNLAVSGNGRTVKLFVSGTPGANVTVSVSGLKDASGLSLPAISGATVGRLGLVSRDIGAYTGDPAFPSKLWVENTNAFTVEAQGSDIWGTADGFNFLYEQKTGDFDVVVRHVKITHTSQWAKGGLMIRETLNADSRNWNIINDPASADGIMAPDNTGYGANVIECNWRTNTAGESTGWDNIPRDTAPAYPNAWVRLKRSGQVLTAYYSVDGLTWKLAATQTVSTTTGGALPNTVYVGICTTAHNNDLTITDGKYWNASQYADYNSSYVAPLPAATLKVSLAGANASISWTPAGGRLQSSPTLGTGAVWTDVGTANPATVPVSGQTKFFRVVNP